MDFQALGLPSRSTIRRLLVSEPALMLVVHVQVQSDPDPSRRLLARRFGEETYHALVPHQEGQDIEDPTPSPTTPHVYFNRLLWRDWDGDRGGNWDGLHRVHCETRAVECLLSPATSPSQITGILGISADGTRLFVVGSSPEPGADRVTFHHGVAELDLATLALRPLTALRATFA